MAKSCKSKINNVFNLNLRLGKVMFVFVWFDIFCGAAASKAEVQNTLPAFIGPRKAPAGHVTRE